MSEQKKKIGDLFFIWAFLILLGISVGLNLPFTLAVIATIFYLDPLGAR